MKSKISNPYFHILYWLFVIGLLTLVFGRSWSDSIKAFYFICLLLPIIMGTSYFFNFYMVPKFLFTRKFFWFGLYTLYTLIISLFFEAIVLVFAFVYMVKFNFGEIDPNAGNIFFLAVVLYFVVFMGSFYVMTKQLHEKRKELNIIYEEREKMKRAYLEVISNRKNIRIFFNEIIFIESLADYIKINTINGTSIVSKEKISSLEKRLPDIFLRIHRSYIVNIEMISSYNYEEIELNDITLNIGRSYKKEVIEKLKLNKEK